MSPIFRDKPSYHANGISSLETLSKVMDVRVTTLIGLTKNQSKHYYSFKLTTKNGKVRYLHDPKTLLKKVLKRINSRLFIHIQFPEYLHGGIKDRDYYSNAQTHTLSEYLFSYDVRSFYDNIKRTEVIKIFKHLCHFSDEVSDTLSKLVTLNDRVPQGAPTSSYIANLIFFENEYKVVSDFRKKGINYTRLLDDIVISANKPISTDDKTNYSKKISSLITKSGLKLNNKKTKFVCRKNNDELMNVTGLWVNHANPKCNKEERKNVRASVFQCEQAYHSAILHRENEDYHKLWNSTSGRVAKLARVGHPQAKSLRNRLSIILPVFSAEKIKNINREIFQLEKANSKKQNSYGYLKRLNRMIYFCGIISRTDKRNGKAFRKRLLTLKKVDNYEQFWEKQ